IAPGAAFSQQKGAPGGSASASAPKPPPSASAATSASAPATSSSAPPPAPSVNFPTETNTTIRKQAPTPPPPTPPQVAALEELQKEADQYEKNAKDYRSAITRIVQHHYEDRRRRILSALDSEIATEKKGLRDAREEAIRRLEAFVQKYSGANAHPENT